MEILKERFARGEIDKASSRKKAQTHFGANVGALKPPAGPASEREDDCLDVS
jgi:hypothetical protein